MGLDKVIIAVIALCAILAVLLVGAGVCGLCWFTNNIQTSTVTGPVEHREDKTVHAPADRVSIDAQTFGGNVEVSESESGQIEIVYDVYAPQSHLGDIQTNTSYSRDGDTLVIKATTKIPNYHGQWTGSRGANLYLRLPKNASYDLRLNTAGGNVIVPGFTGDSLAVNTAGGNIDVTGVTYRTITLHTAGGIVDADYNATTAVIETLGGNIVLKAGQTAGTLDANTAGGNVRVTFPENAKFSVDATTLGGHVTHGSIPLVTTSEANTRLAGHTEGGAGNLSATLRTLGGDIEISY